MHSDAALLLQQKIRGELDELRQLGADRRNASTRLPVLIRTGVGRESAPADPARLELPEAEA